jgi:FAD binding domain/Berberine and berberine like
MNQGSHVEKSAVEELRIGLRGQVFAPGDERYDAARAVHNGSIDRRPAVIASCVDVGDVVTALDFGRKQGLEIAIRGGGHSASGHGVADGGLTVDLSRMRWVHVDPDARTARVGGGSLLGDLDHATHAFGLGTPAGIVSTTGLGGLTLGGGHGYLTRTHRLSIDNLLSADVVLADGSFVKTSDSQNEDLFWAIRGGGGNFGVATSLTFRLHRVHTVIAGVTLWDADRAGDVLRWYREFLPQAPTDLNGFFMIFTVPPGPPFPPEIHLKNMAGVVWCSLANPEEQETTFAAVQDLGRAAFHFTAPMPYPALNSLFDGLLPPGLQCYKRGQFFDRITDGAIDAIVEHGSRLPTMLSWMQLYPVDGAAHRVGSNDTAWSYRDAVWSGLIEGFDPNPASAESIRQWCLGFWDALQPHSMGAGYVNFMMDEPWSGVRTAYRENYDRLSRIKRSYDPDNVFHLNQNIKPAS